ncbi:hypothetical protein [Rhizobium sp. NPDC090279]|uniref:hypothetical protein n=1 Tax=Rhizobium sp. NPDC090279 TaxID=3364499 RepID=UPI00383A3583
MRAKVPWFRVKAYGYGAGLPCRWQGWVATVIYVLALIAMIAIVAPHVGSRPAAYAVAIGIPTALMVFVVWWKSDAPWRWRWGEFEDKDGN